jgi:hypothetical protein
MWHIGRIGGVIRENVAVVQGVPSRLLHLRLDRVEREVFPAILGLEMGK